MSADLTLKGHTSDRRLAISLGLAGLGAAEMRVGATWKRWKEGEALVFDDSFEHEVRALGQAIAPTPRAEYSRAARGSGRRAATQAITRVQ